MSRPRLTPHQATIYGVIERRYVHLHNPVPLADIGSRGACEHLERKGYVRFIRSYGLRGGEIIYLVPLIRLNRSPERKV